MYVTRFVSCLGNPCVVGVFVLASLVATAFGSNLNGPSWRDATSGAAGGGIAPVSAADPSVVAETLRQAKIDICHLRAGDFIRLSVAEPAVDAHIAHGDGRVGDPVPGQPGMKFAADCAFVPLASVTIAFEGLSVNGSLITTYLESGFTVSPTSGSWQALTTYGNPAPSAIFIRSAAEPTITSEIQVTGDGSAFTFSSVDLYSSITPIPYTITGLRNSASVFEVSDTVPNTFGNFATVLNPHATAVIDTLLITLSNPATPCCSNPVGLDNIVLMH